MHRLRFHAQSPLHQLAPLPLGQSEHVVAECPPQKTDSTSETLFGMHRLLFHVQSPLHQRAPLPLGQSEQVLAECPPQLTAEAEKTIEIIC